MELITGEEHGLQLSDLGLNTFYISDLWALAISLTFSLCRFGERRGFQGKPKVQERGLQKSVGDEVRRGLSDAEARSE